MRDANGHKLKYYFDNGGNLISVVDVAKNNPIEMYTYDSCMRRHTYNTGYGTANTVYGYDWKDRVTSEEIWINGIKQHDIKNIYQYNQYIVRLLMVCKKYICLEGVFK